MQHLFAIHNKPIFAVCRLIFILSSADAETAQHVRHIGRIRWVVNSGDTRMLKLGKGLISPFPFPPIPRDVAIVGSRFLCLCDRSELENVDPLVQMLLRSNSTLAVSS